MSQRRPIRAYSVSPRRFFCSRNAWKSQGLTPYVPTPTPSGSALFHLENIPIVEAVEIIAKERAIAAAIRRRESERRGEAHAPSEGTGQSIAFYLRVEAEGRARCADEQKATGLSAT